MTFTLTRRRFLAASAVTGGSTLLAPGMVFATPDDPAQGDAMVVIFLRGGADGLSLVAPFNDPGYRELRPSIRIPAPGEGATIGRSAAADALPLTAGGDRFFSSGFSGKFGLHPQLRRLYDGIWSQNRLAIIPACGLPDYESSTRSHFEAEMHWERGTGSRSYLSGWLGRHLAVTQATGTLPAMNSDSRADLLLKGPIKRLSISDLSNFGISGFPTSRDVTLRALSMLYADKRDSFGETVNGLLPSVAAVQDIDPNATANLPRNGAVYPATTYGRRLRHIALLLRSGLGLKAASVSLGGWDSHGEMGFPDDPNAGMYKKIREFGDGLAAFCQDLGSAFNEVSIVVISEFGRTAAENGTGGTDHGRGATIFLAGGGIRGGVYGDFPDRVGVPNKYTVPVITDYRIPVAEVLQNRMANQSVGQVFPTLQAAPYLNVTRR